MKITLKKPRQHFICSNFEIKRFFRFTSNYEVHKIQNIIKRLYLVLSLIGLFPYSIKYQKVKQRFVTIDKSLYMNMLRGISIVMFILIFLCVHIQDVIMTSAKMTMTEVLMTQLNYILELVNYALFCISAYIVAYHNRHSYMTMFNTFISTWNALPESKNSQKIIYRLHYQINTLTMMVLLVLMVLQMCVNFTRHSSFWKMILVTITFNLPQMIQFIILAFYYNLVMMAVALLANINEQFKEIVNDKSHPLLYVKQVYSEITLKKLELIYAKAFEFTISINKAFQAPILISTVQCFHSIVSEAHIIYHGVMNNYFSIHDVFNCSIWIVYQLLKIYCLAYSGNLLKTKALIIGQTLHNIPSESQDLRWLMEVQHFATLMKYQKIEITIYGYFPLDATLMANIIASATMYLIILVQFDRKS